MTPKERVLAALRHEPADRVPHGEFATDYSVIAAALGRPVYWRGKRRYYEALWDGRRDEVVASLGREIVDFTLTMGIDMVPVHAVPHRDMPFLRPDLVAPDTWRDANGNVLKYSVDTEDIGLHAVTGNGLAQPDFRLPDAYDDSELELARYVVACLGKTHFVFLRPGRFHGLGYSAGWSEGMFIEVAEHPERVAARELQNAEALAPAIESFADLGIDGVAIGSDYGYNSGPFVSPTAFARVYAPAMKRQCDIVHSFGLPCLFHSCGNNRLILDQMVEAGMDAYQAIQPVERIEQIKALFGDRLTLWGGVSTDTLARGTPEQVRAQALFALQQAAAGGGFILSSSHSILVRTPLANYQTMVETCHERGHYPIDISERLADPYPGSA
jgi:hypothetical protein